MASVQYMAAGSTVVQISQSIEAHVRSGALAPGAPLPAVRTLASELHVAPGTVAAAYKALRDRGVLESQGRRGTFVRSRPPVSPRAWMPAIGAGAVDVASGQPDPALLPDLGRIWPGVLAGPAAAPNSLVEPQLLAVAGSRLAADGVATASMTLACGGLDAMHRLLAVQMRPGDTVAVEDPGWPNLLDLLAALGMRGHPMAIDNEGPRPAALRDALHAGARAAVVTSRAQNPTGGFVTPTRASALRAVLNDYPRTLLLEDDHAAELAEVPLATLAGATQSWAFIRSTSKPYGPDLRLAVIAGDEATIARVEGRMLAGSGWVSTVLQRLVLGLWTSPDAEAVVRDAGRTYTGRRELLIAQLASHGVAATGATGVNVWIPVHNETAATTTLLQSGWAVAPGARFRQRSGPGIRITVDRLTDQSIIQLARDIARAVTAPPARYMS